MVSIGNDWDKILKDEFEKDYYKDLRQFLIKEYKTRTIYPDMYDIFNALKWSSFDHTRVVIIGQDPYPNPGQAHGLSFSVKKGIAKPASLINIFKELKSDLDIDAPEHGCLEDWAKQGVLLLNAVLTVRGGQVGSHRGKGWEILTDKIIKVLNQKDTPIVFILWGNYAKAKKSLITNPKHCIIQSAHPSPLAAYGGFFGSKPFSKTNEFLTKNKLEPINWQIN